jgi:hypothetical protein
MKTSAVVPVAYSGPTLRPRRRRQPNEVWPLLLCSPATISLVGYGGLLLLRLLPLEIRLPIMRFFGTEVAGVILAVSLLLAIVTALLSLFLYTRGRYKTRARQWNLLINSSFLLIAFALLLIALVHAAKDDR